MNDAPLFSICMCTYNRYEYVRYTIGSILEQSFNKNDFEIVVCDSGSTDGTVEYLNSLDNVKLHDIGFLNLASSYIYAFNMASGKYIINLNDHMYLNADNLLKCLKDLDDNSNIGCVMYSFSAYGFGVFNRKPFEFPTYLGRGQGLLLHHLFIFRKDDVKYFDENYNRNCWDIDFIINSLMRGNSIGLYKYVFGCELKIDDNNDGILCKQRVDENNNTDDEKYFKKKYKVFLESLIVDEKISFFIVINRLTLRFVNYYLTKVVTNKNFLPLLKDEIEYTINKLPLGDDSSENFDKLNLKDYRKTISSNLYKLINRLLYNSVDVATVDKSKSKNFYLLQKLRKDLI